MEEILQIAFFVFFAGVKILIAPSTMLAAGFGVFKTMLVTYIGGLLGAIVFYYFGVAIFKWWERITGAKNKAKKRFSRKSRTLVKVKSRYGIIGLACLAPIISIPLSAFLVARFFPGKDKVVAVYAVVLVPVSMLLTWMSNPVIQFMRYIFQ